MRRRKKMKKIVKKYLCILTLQKLLLSTTHRAYHYNASEGDNDL